MGAICSSSHGQNRHKQGGDHISLSRSITTIQGGHHSLNTFSPKFQFGRDKLSRTSITSEEFENIQVRASAEMKKASSFRIPNARVSFIGLNNYQSVSPSKAKSQEELNLELSTSFLPQHLLYCLRYIYYGGEGKQYKVKLGHHLQKTNSNEGLDTESKFSSFLSVSTGSASNKGSDRPHSPSLPPGPTSPIPNNNVVNNSDSNSRSSSPSSRGALVNNKKKSSPGINLWKKYKQNGSTSSIKPVEEEKMKLLSPVSEFSYETCILLIEMKGFSKIVDSFYHEKDNCNVSEISRYIYYVYTSLIAVIYEMGGDIEKFQGDLIICQFYSPRMDRTFTDSILAAVKCGIKIQTMTNLKTYKSDDTPLEVKCVINVGECTSYHLGGFGSQWLRIFGGEVLLRVRELLKECKQGNVYISGDIFEKCSQFLRANEESPNLFQVTSLSRDISSHPLDSVSFHYTFANALYLFMNRNVLYGIESKTLDTFNRVMELVLCTVSIKPSSFGSSCDEFDLATKNNIVNSIQVVSEQYNCCVLDMFFDRKSLKFILSFERHMAESNPSLVIHCLKELIHRENLEVDGVGFASGYGYRASVGSDFRRHFGLYGELINSSIAHCNYAIDHLESGIICDGTTASILDEVCTIRFLGTCEIEGGKTQKLHLISMNEPPPQFEISRVENNGTIRASDTNTNIYLNIDTATDVHSMNSVQISEERVLV